MALSAVTFAQLAISFAIQWYTVTQLGAGADTDALYAALTVPQMVMLALIDPLAFVLTPLLSRRNERERRIIGSQIFWVVAGCSILIAAGAGTMAPVTVPVLAPGFSEATAELAVSLARIEASAIAGAACTMVLTGLYHAGQVFLWPAIAMLISSIVGWLILLVGIHSGGIVLAAWVQVITFGGPVFFLIRSISWWPWSSYSGLLRLLSEVWWQCKPLIASAFYYRTGFIVDRLLTSFLAPGSIVVLELASRVHFAVVRIVNQGITAPIVPVLASLSGQGSWLAFKQQCRERLMWIVLLSSAAVFGLAAIAVVSPYLYPSGGERPVVGALRSDDLNKLTVALILGSGVLLFGSISHLAMSAFYAQGDTRAPTKLQVFTYSIGIALKAAGFFLGGLYGIMAAMSVSYAIDAIVLGGALDRRLRLRLSAEPQASLELSVAGVPPRSL
ncbi:MAG TPA: lipid II flippase MurJ [Nitrospiraceae bacterium]|nr:lipid II flippase MurJ [Nitrospiraceae bacterium]